jgi:CBS domain-containing protein
MHGRKSKRKIMIQNILDRKGSEVVTVLATDTIKIAADKMREHSVAALVVTSGDAIKGLISERDIVHAVSRQGQAALTTTVATIMTHSVVTITPSDSLRHAMQLMTSHRVRHLPVVVDGELLGIVSIGDVVKLRLEDLETETNVLREVHIATR